MIGVFLHSNSSPADAAIVLYHNGTVDHRVERDHPEQNARVVKCAALLRSHSDIPIDSCTLLDLPSVVVLRLVHSGDYLERIIKSTRMSRKKRNEMGVMIHSDREVDEDDEDDMLLGWDSATHSASDEQSEDNEDSDDEEEDSDDEEEEEENSEEESDQLVRERRTAQVEKKGRKSVKSGVRRSRSSRDTKPGRKKIFC